MTKYYDDPLQAAWMAREFGVAMNPEGDGMDEYAGKVYSHEIVDLAQKGRFDVKYYIHPDSYHIFEPQDWDLGRYVGTYPFAWFKENGWFTQNEKCEPPDAGDVIEITRRDNKAFFMPLEEEDE